MSVLLDMLEARRERVEARRDRILDTILGASPPPQSPTRQSELPRTERREEEIPEIPAVDEKLFVVERKYGILTSRLIA